MKFLKRLLYGIMAVITVFSGLVLICVIKPDLAKDINRYLYKQEEKGLQQDMEDSLLQIEDDEQAEEELLVETLNEPLAATANQTQQIPQEVQGKNGYQPIRQNELEVYEEDVKVIQEQLGVGETGDGLTFESRFYPYYEMLDDLQQKLYRQIFANAMAGNANFAPVTEVTPQELKNVFMAVYNDHPEIFWMESAYSCKYLRNGYCVEINLVFYPMMDSLNLAKEEFANKATPIIEQARGYGSDYEKEMFVHDTLISQITYALDAPMNQSAYSALVSGYTVCAGYARAFQYIMQQLGIPCFYCTGFAGENHAWNIIELDAEYYNVDSTWNDTDPNTHDYFNKTDADFASTHRREDLSVNLPPCTGEKYTGEIKASEIPKDTLRDMETYFQKCKEEMSRVGVGNHTFEMVMTEELWEELDASYKNGNYEVVYAKPFLEELGAMEMQVDMKGEPQADGTIVVKHTTMVK